MVLRLRNNVPPIPVAILLLTLSATGAICLALLINRTRSGEFASPAAVNLLFDRQEIDLGEIPQGQIAQGLFPFSNMGSYPIRIRDVKVDCSCGVSEYTESAIPPKGRGRIFVNIKTNNKVGNIRNKFEITYEINGRINTANLTTQAMVYTAGKTYLTPEAIYLGNVRPDQVIEKELDILGVPENRATVWKFADFACPPWVQIRDIRTVSNARAKVKLSLTIPGLSGELKGTVLLHTGNATFPTTEAPIYATVESEYHAVPPRIIKALAAATADGPFNVTVQDAKLKQVPIHGFVLVDVTGGTLEALLTSASVLTLKNIRWNGGSSIVKGSLHININDKGIIKIVVCNFFYVKK